MLRVESLPVARPFADTLARRLLDAHGDDLPRTMVMLPSTRAARSLRHALLEISGRDAVLLPEVVTPAQVVTDLALRLGLDADPFPSELRAEWLARDLAGESWLAERPEAAPGLAAELVTLFDDMRRHGLDPAAPSGGDAELMDDADRVTAAWTLYRRRVPRDAVDVETQVTAALATADPWPGRPVTTLWIAGFVAMPPVRARLITALADHADEARLVLSPAAGRDPVQEPFAASWADAEAPTHPDAPTRLLAARFTTEPEGPDEGSGAAPAPELVPAGTPEDESRRIASRVVERLDAAPGSRIVVATNDRALAARVVAQLRDAGLDLDDSSGIPLSSTPAGRLAWLLARCVTTGPAHEPLLELLTHPLARFGRPAGLQRRRALILERELLRGRTPPGDLEGYRARAADHDATVRQARPEALPELTELVDDVAGVLAPLTALADGGPRPLDAFAAALRASRDLAVAKAEDDTTDRPPTADDIALDGLLDMLANAAPSGPALGFGDAAALFTRLSGSTEVRSHRSEFLPVQVTGLLEARLEHCDLLILGGLSEDIVPGRMRRPLFLGRAWRERVGLPDWREMLGRQAELFHRLLHAGDEVVLSWPSERDGQPALPSPFVQRLLLRHEADHPSGPAPLYRRAGDVATASVRAPRLAPGAFADAPERHAEPRTLKHVSPSALARFRDCPYRWLLESGYGLKEQDGILEALESRDQGTIIHETLAAWLDPVGPGVQALAEGRTDDARRLLAEAAADRFSHHAGGLPQRPLWEASFLSMADDLVAYEAERITAWRPAAVEEPFELPLGVLRDWLDDGTVLSDAEATISLKGRIDRLDVRRDGEPGVMVLDYKTGSAPSSKDIGNGVDLQLACYALAALLAGAGGLSVGEDDFAGEFYMVKRDKVGIRKPVPLTVEMLRRDGAAVLETALAMIRCEGPFPLAPGQEGSADPKPCRYCHLAGVCRRDERLALAREEATP